jgi:hypothetical protein
VNLLGKNKFGDLIFKILISYIIFIILIYVFNHDNYDRLSSFLIVFFAAIIALFLLGIGGVSRYGFNITKYFIIGFLIKIVIGFLFWELYLFPDYFSISTSQFHFDHFEYLYTNQLMQEFAEYRISNGIFSYPIVAILAKSGFIHYLMSNMYLSGSFNPLDLAVQNSLFSIFTALIIAHIVKLEGGSSKQIKFALLLTIFQPLSFISTIIWRDVVGQFFIALGGYLLYSATRANKILMLFFAIMASLSMFLQRYIYTLYPFIAIGGYYLFQNKNKLRLLLVVPLLGYFVNYFDNLLSLSSHLTESYGNNISGLNFWIFLPLNIIRLFIGPFPWTNWFTFDDNTIFLIADYFQVVINITLVIMLVKIIFKKKYLLKSNTIYSALSSVDVLFMLLFSLFIFAGLGTKEIHHVYMSTGIIFIIPTISLGYTNQSFKSIFMKVFVFFIVLNVLFIVLGLSGGGLGGSFR